MILTSNINWDEFIRFLSLIDRELVREFDASQGARTTQQFLKLFKRVFPNHDPLEHIYLSVATRIPQSLQSLIVLRSKLTIAFNKKVFFLSGNLVDWTEILVILLTNCEEDLDTFYQEMNSIVLIIESINKYSFSSYQKVQKYEKYFELREP